MNINMLLQSLITKQVAVYAMETLANVDYSVATQVSENVANVIKFAYEHDQWWLSQPSIELLRFLDNSGSVLISMVVWIVMHAR